MVFQCPLPVRLPTVYILDLSAEENDGGCHGWL